MTEKKDAPNASETLVTGRVLDAGGRPVPQARTRNTHFCCFRSS